MDFTNNYERVIQSSIVSSCQMLFSSEILCLFFCHLEVLARLNKNKQDKPETGSDQIFVLRQSGASNSIVNGPT